VARYGASRVRDYPSWRAVATLAMITSPAWRSWELGSDHPPLALATTRSCPNAQFAFGPEEQPRSDQYILVPSAIHVTASYEMAHQGYPSSPGAGAISVGRLVEFECAQLIASHLTRHHKHATQDDNTKVRTSRFEAPHAIGKPDDWISINGWSGVPPASPSGGRAEAKVSMVANGCVPTG